jgi:hypothetical protein
MSNFLELLRTEEANKLIDVLNQLNLDTEEERDNTLFSSRRFKSIISRQSTFENTFRYYNNIFKPSNFIVENLVSCDEIVNLDVICELEKVYEEKKDTRNLNIIHSFKPETHPVVYNRTQSITGRQTIVDGPQILVLKKEDRKKIFNSNLIRIFDFAALEPCILFQICEQNDLDYSDLYESIKTKLDMRYITREEIKATVLRLIYGSSIANLTSLNEAHKLEFIKLNEYLYSIGIKELKQILHEQLHIDGWLYNFFGKPILSKEQAERIGFQDYMLINYYIQSTAADLSLLFFSNFYKQNKTKIKPLFIIHDALMFIDLKQAFPHGAKTQFSVENFSLFLKTE